MIMVNSANWWYDDGSAWYFFQMVKAYREKERYNAGIFIIL